MDVASYREDIYLRFLESADHRVADDLSCFPVAMCHSDYPGGSRQLNIFGAAL